MLTVGFQGFSVFANNRPGTCYACALQQETTRGSKTSAVALATQVIETISVFVKFSIKPRLARGNICKREIAINNQVKNKMLDVSEPIPVPCL